MCSQPPKPFCPCMGLTHAIFCQCLDCGQIICEAFDPLLRKCPACNLPLTYPAEIESLLSNRKIRTMQSLKPDKNHQISDMCIMSQNDCHGEKCLKEWHDPKILETKTLDQHSKKECERSKSFQHRKATTIRIGKV